MSQALHLRELINRSKRTLFYAALFSLAINLLMLLLPIYSLQVLDRVISSHSIETLIMLTIVVVVGFVFYGIFTAIRTSMLNGINDWLDQALAPHLLYQSIARSAIGVQTSAGIYLRELVAIKNFIAGGGVVTILDAPWALIFVFVIYMINPVLGLVTVVGIAILLVFGLINEYSTRKPIRQSLNLANRSQSLADIACRNAEAIESMGMMKNVIAHWKEAHSESTRYQMVAAERGNMVQSISRVLRLLVQVAVTGVGGYLALENMLSVGGMIASSILVGRAMAPFENAIGLWKSWITARDAYTRLNETMEVAQLLERGTLPLPAPQGNLTVESLIFTPPKSAPIIKGINFSLAAGEALGIIGPSAAGKSTLAKLIIGLLPPTHGAVRLDGMETFKWNRENFGSYVGYLPQNVDLFPGTIKDNIARMDKNASMDDVIQAAKRAHVHELILRLPQGYETECGLGNLGLSPGQRQRIGLARALYGNPQFVVLDEPNLNLDGDGERALVDALAELKRQRITYIVVAHRPTVVSTVDKLIVMRSGLIERFGARDEVLKAYTAPPPPAATVKASA